MLFRSRSRLSAQVHAQDLVLVALAQVLAPQPAQAVAAPVPRRDRCPAVLQVAVVQAVQVAVPAAQVAPAVAQVAVPVVLVAQVAALLLVVAAVVAEPLVPLDARVDAQLARVRASAQSGQNTNSSKRRPLAASRSPVVTATR